MERIDHTYTIQWVGPMNYEEYKDYLRNGNTLSPEYFNLYYFETRQDKRCKWSTYFGIHKLNNGINNRVNTTHEHLGPFIKNGAKEIKIWIGSFARKKDQKANKIDIVETLFIKAYNDKLTENTMKKASLPASSVCIVNTYYETKGEQLTNRRPKKPSVFDDVLIYLAEADCFMHGNLSKFRNLK